MEPDGDDKLRSNYHQRMREMLKVGRRSDSGLAIAASVGEVTEGVEGKAGESVANPHD